MLYFCRFLENFVYKEIQIYFYLRNFLENIFVIVILKKGKLLMKVNKKLNQLVLVAVMLIALALGMDAYAEIIITEIHIDGTADGSPNGASTTCELEEYIEVYNSGTTPVDLSGCYVDIIGSTSDGGFPSGAAIPPKSFAILVKGDQSSTSWGLTFLKKTYSQSQITQENSFLSTSRFVLSDNVSRAIDLWDSVSKTKLLDTAVYDGTLAIPDSLQSWELKDITLDGSDVSSWQIASKSPCRAGGTIIPSVAPSAAVAAVPPAAVIPSAPSVTVVRPQPLAPPVIASPVPSAPPVVSSPTPPSSIIIIQTPTPAPAVPAESKPPAASTFYSNIAPTATPASIEAPAPIEAPVPSASPGGNFYSNIAPVATPVSTTGISTPAPAPALAPATSTFTGGNVVSCDLGVKNIDNGMSETTPFLADGNTAGDSSLGREHRYNKNSIDGNIYFYFKVDDSFIYQGNYKNVTVNFDYYDDTGSILIKLQYDSVDSAYKDYPTTITTGGTKNWKTASFTIDDALFGNRENDGSDLRILVEPILVRIDKISVTKIGVSPAISGEGAASSSGASSLFVPLQTAPGATPQTSQLIDNTLPSASGGQMVVSCDLGEINANNGLSFPKTPLADGRTTADTSYGRGHRYNANPSTDHYVYFDVSDSTAFKGNHPAVKISIDYYDSKGLIRLQYDSVDSEYKEHSTTVAFTNTNKWKTAEFLIDDAYFGNRENNGTDFRLFVGFTKVCLDKVTVDFSSSAAAAAVAAAAPAQEASAADISVNANATVPALPSATPVTISTAAGELILSCDLGTRDVYNHLLRPTTEQQDGRTIADTSFGREHRHNADPKIDHYIYFDVDDSIAYQGNNKEAKFYVDYYDSPVSSIITLDYDAESSAYKEHLTKIKTGGTDVWKTAEFIVNDAYFGNRQNRGCDFRIAFGRDNNNIVRIDKVTVIMGNAGGVSSPAAAVQPAAPSAVPSATPAPAAAPAPAVEAAVPQASPAAATPVPQAPPAAPAAGSDAPASSKYY